MATEIYRLTKPQAKIFSSKKRFKIVNAGRRFGKTWVSGAFITEKAQNHNKKTVIYVAPTLNMARNLMWDTWIKDHIPEEYIKHKNEQNMVMTFHTNSKFYCMSAEHPDRLRGLAADLLIIDECAMIDDDFYDVVSPVLADKHHDGEALFISTPKGYNWFYDLYHFGLKHPESYDCFQFTTIEGGNVSEEKIAEDKARMTPKMFAQEYLASFETLSARVYENFDRILNSCNWEDDFGFGDIHVGMDFNVNPMTAVIANYHRGRLCIFDEIVEKNSNTDEVAKLIKQKYPGTTVYVYPDPTGHRGQTNAPVGQTDFSILRKHGFIVNAPSRPYATKDKFNNVNAALCDSNLHRHVFVVKDRCPSLRRAWEGYTYKENGDTDKSSGLDHISDAAAYLICYKMPFYSNHQVLRPKVFGI